jgi:NADH:ubiquinone oxidoreductase subunit F (NADH-binding)
MTAVAQPIGTGMPTGPALLDGRAHTSLEQHLSACGALPAMTGTDVVRLVADAAIIGHGGAGFPLWRKLDAIRSVRGRPIVVANGAEGEPASAKDRWLLRYRPHLVLDGLQLAVRATKATDAFLYVNPTNAASIQRVLAERHQARLDRIDAVAVSAPDFFIAGEESAVVNWLSGGDAVPRSKPPRVIERGVRGRPTLVSNLETLALLALAARRGAAWYRAMGTPQEPGTMLFTVSGAVRDPGIVEAPYGAALGDVLELGGGPSRSLQAVLVGGYHGSWLTAAEAASAQMSRAGLARFGASPGAGVVVAVPDSACGLVELSRVMGYLAQQSAGQCGPCLNGLPRLAAMVKSLAFNGGDPNTPAQLERIAGIVAGRGACHHPDGSVRFLRSGLRVFANEVALHLRGRCSRTSDDAVLPTPSAYYPAA